MAPKAQPTRPPPQAAAWDSADPLGKTLQTFRMQGVVYARSCLSAPWGMSLPPMPGCLMFHVVTAGECTLKIENETTCILRPGEFALIPHGQGHAIVSKDGVPAVNYFDLPIEHVSDKYEVLKHGGGGSETILICGAVRVDHPAAQDLVRLLPKLIHIKAWNSPHANWMHSTLRLIAAEAQAQMPGGETIVTGLSDILVVQAIRAWLLDHREERTGWLGALDDERIGPVLVQIQQDPSQPWTVESLAAAANMSRSAFAARFNELVGESPMHFVTRWRMHAAGTWLRDDGLTIAECGSRLGYNSEAAFSRAFKRVMGVPPGAWKHDTAETV